MQMNAIKKQANAFSVAITRTAIIANFVKTASIKSQSQMARSNVIYANVLVR